MSDSVVRRPETAVPVNMDDPVKKARAELRAALIALEEKANVPKRVSTASRRFVSRVRVVASEHRAAAAVGVVVVGIVVGVTVWAVVRRATR